MAMLRVMCSIATLLNFDRSSCISRKQEIRMHLPQTKRRRPQQTQLPPLRRRQRQWMHACVLRESAESCFK